MGASASIPDAVVLLQMGGPGDLRSVRPFLAALFRDPDIIRLPAPMRRFQGALAQIIAASRAPLVKPRYRAMGGGSPLNAITARQAAALETRLGVPVRVANRYTAPFANEVCRELKGLGVRRVLLLPLYPHWSHATTGSSMRDFLAACDTVGLDAEVHVRRAWGDEPAYAALIAATCQEAITADPVPEGTPVHVILSAHSIPEGYAREGDPSCTEVEATARAVQEHLSDAFASVRLAYQSAVGPVKWVGPSTDDAIDELASDGTKALLLVPFGFVSDHIETLFDLDTKYRKQAKARGVRHYRRAASFNDREGFIALLAQLVRSTPQASPQEVVPSIPT